MIDIIFKDLNEILKMENHNQILTTYHTLFVEFLNSKVLKKEEKFNFGYNGDNSSHYIHLEILRKDENVKPLTTLNYQFSEVFKGGPNTGKIPEPLTTLNYQFSEVFKGGPNTEKIPEPLTTLNL